MYRIWYNSLKTVYVNTIEEVSMYCRLQRIVSGETPYWEEVKTKKKKKA